MYICKIEHRFIFKKELLTKYIYICVLINTLILYVIYKNINENEICSKCFCAVVI